MNASTTIFVIVAVALCLSAPTVLGSFFRKKPRGIHYGEETAAWAQTRFPAELQPLGAYVAEVLMDQTGVRLSEIEPGSRFTEDLRADELEPVEIVMALEEDLDLSIPDEDCTELTTVADLVDYLHRRLHATKSDFAPSP